jgi:hypothetical protein
LRERLAQALTGCAERQPLTVAQVLNGIPLAAALPAPIARPVAMRPDPEAILATAPGAGAGIFAPVDVRDFAQLRIATQQLQQGHHYHAPPHEGFFRNDVLLFSLF